MAPRHPPRSSVLAVLAAVVSGLLVLVAAAVGAAPVSAAGHSTERVGSRSYELYRPAELAGAAPLVVMLHGRYGTGEQARRSYSWPALAEKEGLVAAFPEGTGRSWNAGTCCGSAEHRGVDDVGFLRQVVADVGRKVPIDPERVFVTGISNGARMAYRLVCETSLFAAAAPVAGTMMVPCDRASSVLHIHGDADPFVPYRGGPGLSWGRDGAREAGPAIPDVIDGFRARGNCSAPAQTVRGSVTTSVAACPDGRAVGLITIAGGGHRWPAGSGSGGGPLNATAVIWDFFAAR